MGHRTCWHTVVFTAQLGRALSHDLLRYHSDHYSHCTGEDIDPVKVTCPEPPSHSACILGTHEVPSGQGNTFIFQRIGGSSSYCLDGAAKGLGVGGS